MPEGADFDRIFPEFIWVVRDFTLELEVDGKPTTPDSYMEHMLKLQQGIPFSFTFEKWYHLTVTVHCDFCLKANS